MIHHGDIGANYNPDDELDPAFQAVLRSIGHQADSWRANLELEHITETTSGSTLKRVECLPGDTDVRDFQDQHDLVRKHLDVLRIQAERLMQRDELENAQRFQVVTGARLKYVATPQHGDDPLFYPARYRYDKAMDGIVQEANELAGSNRTVRTLLALSVASEFFSLVEHNVTEEITAAREKRTPRIVPGKDAAAMFIDFAAVFDLGDAETSNLINFMDTGLYLGPLSLPNGEK